MLTFIISFIIGGLISIILYGKVPVIISLIISFIAGIIVGLYFYIIKKRKAEREYVMFLTMQRHMINSKKEES